MILARIFALCVYFIVVFMIRNTLVFLSMMTTPLSLNSFSKKASVIYFVTTPIYNDFFYLTVVIK